MRPCPSTGVTGTPPLASSRRGLPWNPHVGCFVWDPEGLIPADSPFPDRVYFILNLGHFLRLLGTAERVRERLVWLPTWHQARLAAEKLGVDGKALRNIWEGEKTPQPGEELLRLYELLLAALEKR